MNQTSFGTIRLSAIRHGLRCAGFPMKQIMALVTCIGLLATASAVRAQTAGEPLKGRAFAEAICAECHAIFKGQRRSPNSEAPSFSEIATTPGMTSVALAAALRTSHRRMPNIILSDEQLSSVTAYVLSLQ
jgi:mono/diheme cytochrome c family protein